MYFEQLKNVSIHADPKCIAAQDRRNMTVTVAGKMPAPSPTIRSTLGYYIRVIRWLVKHRTEQNNRQKWRRMERELK